MQAADNHEYNIISNAYNINRTNTFAKFVFRLFQFNLFKRFIFYASWNRIRENCLENNLRFALWNE